MEKISRTIIVKLIKAYQYLISPLLGNRCRFHPNCSQYGLESLYEHKLHYALWLISKRLLKCHPLHKGGFDPVPKNKRRLKS